MSITNTATSTLSTLLNNFLVVVKNGDNNTAVSGGVIISSTAPNVGSSSSSSNSSYTNIAVSTTTSRNCLEEELAQNSVTHDIPQIKIITVITMLTLFSVFGCLGNGLVLYVFSKKSDKVTSTIFILALAWADFFTCLVFMPFTVVYISLDSRLYLGFFCKLYNFLNTCNVPLSAFIMVAIAVDRYFSICHPFVHMVTPRRARVALLSLVLVAFTLGSITACIYDAYRTVNTPDEPIDSPSGLCCNDTANASLHLNTHQVTDPQRNHYSSELPNAFTEKHLDVGINSSSVLNSQNFSGHTSNKCPPQNIDGLCIVNDKILSSGFTYMYQKIYISFYAISLLAVFSLYFLIYRSVAERRAWRRKQKSWNHSPMTMTGAVTIDADNKFNDVVYLGEGENMELSPQNNSTLDSPLHLENKENEVGDHKSSRNSVTTHGSRKGMTTGSVKPICTHENGLDSCRLNSSSAEKKINRERRDFNFLANIRTAIMLFVVTLVFIVSFLPAWLMATEMISYEIIVFYMHFIYNMANPIIYAFMNQSFRKEVRRVFQRDCGLKCCKRRNRLPSDRNFSRGGMTAISICDSPVDGKGHNPIYKSPSTES